MKLAHYILSAPIEWKEANINTLIVENSKLYRELLNEINEQLLGLNGRFVLSQENEIIDFPKNIEMISNVISLDTESNKRIISGIVKELTAIGNNEELNSVMNMYNGINFCVASIIEKLGEEITYDDINDISQILKLYNVRPDTSGLSAGEALLFHMKLCEKYLKKRLFIVINLHSFFVKEEIDLLFKNIIYEKYNLLIIERYDIEASRYEKKRIIDADLCEL
ncbi:MAG: type II-A CRISPR-associated protein Csn2 [Clostridia bacterium]|nr:type II-A CRISPR-associated protein Csn2 [Clostridia bacterium]